MPIYCEHHDCRCDTAAELAWMAESLNRSDLLAKAMMVHAQRVRCRHVPRRGPVLAPLPSRGTS